ncbi:MAG TPA: hypothetical protein VLA61_05900 [Ideonella sp.]|uniref:hypothetical protein n=1 Tax=Ideonella sp. TaxID=1929293 RepID=UPI002D0AB58E|nr:hypothetical protein [Ideonella sp.]HSI47780.1 hypothetical protein [Ideonella sp.]
MNSRPNSLLRRLIGLPAGSASHQQDPADMGTAIGMEYTLDQPPLPHHAESGGVRGQTPSRGWFARRHNN